jgi:predicted secreted protein
MTSYGAYGTLLKIGDGGSPSESFTSIAQVTSIGGPSLGLDPIEVTHHASTGGWEEFVGGILRSGEVTLDINYDPVEGTHDASTGLIAEMVAKTVRNFQLVFPDAGSTTWTFGALVTAFEPSAPVADKLAASVTLKLSGQPTLA